MDDRYYGYFRERFNEVREDAVSGGSVNRGADAATIHGIERANEAARELGYDGLRPDAELALYLGFRELVARPVAVVRGERSSELAEIVASDMELVVRQAAEESRGRSDVRGPQLSAHAVINALGRSWDGLRSAYWDLWD